MVNWNNCYVIIRQPPRATIVGLPQITPKQLPSILIIIFISQTAVRAADSVVKQTTNQSINQCAATTEMSPFNVNLASLCRYGLLDVPQLVAHIVHFLVFGLWNFQVQGKERVSAAMASLRTNENNTSCSLTYIVGPSASSASSVRS